VPKTYSHCPACHRKGVYLVTGYGDPRNPFRCKFCYACWPERPPDSPPSVLRCQYDGCARGA
jgi:hypothetical protein